MPEETQPTVSVQDWTSLSVTLGGLLEGQRSQNEQLGRIESKIDDHSTAISALTSAVDVLKSWREGVEKWRDGLVPEKGRGLMVGSLISSAVIGIAGIVTSVIALMHGA